MSDRLATLVEQLAGGAIVPLAEAEWIAVAGGFPTRDIVPTGLAGEILLVRRPLPGGKKQAWALVEQPETGKRVIRPFARQDEARALIAERLAAYERMWDG